MPETLKSNPVNLERNSNVSAQEAELSVSKEVAKYQMTQTQSRFNGLLEPAGELYQKYPFLLDYADFLWDRSLSDVSGEGNFWIVLYGPDERVFKIGKNDECSRKLMQEYENHKKFYLALENLRAHPLFMVPDYFRIPEVSLEPLKITGKVSGKGLFIYEMERIQGMTLLRKELLQSYQEQLEGKKTEGLKDKDIIDLLVDCGISEEEISLSCARWITVLKEHFPVEWAEISSILDQLRNEGYEHMDLHSGNIMISKDADGSPIVYMIDYGLSKSPPISPQEESFP